MRRRPALAVIYNPNSRKNRRAAAGRAGRLQRIVSGWGEVFETRRLDELGPVVAELLERGVDYLVSDGGDGSFHWAVNEARSAAGRASSTLPALVPTNGGTIDFVARKVGIEGNAERILVDLTRALADQRPPPLSSLDSLELSGIEIGPDGKERPFNRIGFALAAGGIGQRFFDKYYREKELGARGIVSVVARAVTSYAADRVGLPLPESALRYGREVFRPTRARVVIDGREVPGRDQGALHAGAFDISLGGVFRVFPLGREPGVLHFQAGAIVPREIIGALPNLYRGEAIPSARLVEVGGREMTIEADGEPLFPIIDGEMFGPLTRLEVRRGPLVQVPRIVHGRSTGR
jgi:diacylglycerol kinase family enzyme